MTKATDVLDDFAAAVVAFDPQSASKAQVAMMEAELSELGSRLAEAEAEVQREHRETQELKQSYEQYLQAAQILQAKLSEGKDPAEAAETEASLAKVLDKLEQMKPEIEREEREDQEVAEWRSELRLSFEELGQKIRSAHTELKSAHRQMEMASLHKDRVLEQDRRAREAAGLTSSISSISVALDAMNQETSKVRAETEALKLRAGLLQPISLDSDPNIAAALAAARGAPAIDRDSLSQRLAALSGGGEMTKLKPAA
jgi:chromosome segregation ATPase